MTREFQPSLVPRVRTSRAIAIDRFSKRNKLHRDVIKKRVRIRKRKFKARSRSVVSRDEINQRLRTSLTKAICVAHACEIVTLNVSGSVTHIHTFITTYMCLVYGFLRLSTVSSSNENSYLLSQIIGLLRQLSIGERSEMK